MTDGNPGGIAVWSGSSFELRLGAEFCAYMLAGEFAGLSPGAVSMVQPQAPETIDDLVVEFDSGDRWAFQAKAGKLQISWKETSPFSQALLQLYEGARAKQVDIDPKSSDRMELAFEEEKAAATVKAFGSWLDKARRHSSWQGFASSCTSKEEESYLQGLRHLLNMEPDDGTLLFLKKVHLRGIRKEEEQWQMLRGLLLRSGVVETSFVDGLLIVLLASIEKAAPYRGQIRYDDLVHAAENAGISVNGIYSSSSFLVLEEPDEKSLINSIDLSPVHPRFIDRPELSAMSSAEGVLVLGRKGSGKSRTLIKLVQPNIPALIIRRGFGDEDIGRLLQRTEILKRRIHGPYQMIWDDIQLKPKLFSDLAEKLRERKDDARILCACRSEQIDEIEAQLGESFWKRAGIIGKVVLRDLDENQALEITDAVRDALSLEMDEAARRSFAEHVFKGDGGPLFAVSIGQLILQNTGKRLRAADVKGLPEELLETWKALYKSLSDRPHMQSLLNVLKLLHDVGCPQDERICRLLYTQLSGRSREDFRQSIQFQEGLWIKREGGMLSTHDISMEAVPEDADRFRDMVEFALGEESQDDLSMGILRGSISAFFQSRIPYASQKEERKNLSKLSINLGEKAVESFRKTSNLIHLATSLAIASNSISDGAGLETTREARAEKLQKAIQYIEEAIKVRRDLGLQANIATSLNNASNRYSDLAELEATQEARAEKLQKAIEYIEEAIKIRRYLGLQANVATSLNNASSFYSDLARLETTREARAEKLQKAIEYIEEAIKICSDLGLQANVATSLNNASNLYSDLVGLETTREARAEKLQKAIEYIEEAIRIFRDLGRQADIAMSLNNASSLYRDLARLVATQEARAEKLQKAIEYIEEAIKIRRDLGLQADIATSLNNASNPYSDLAGLEATQEARAEKLQKAIEYIEEAIMIYRDLELQADIAMSMNNASTLYSDLAGLEATQEARAEKLQKAIEHIEEAIRIYRDLGLQADIATSLNNASNRYSDLAGLEATQEARAEKLQKAIEYIEEAIKIRRDLGLQDDIAMSLNNASNRYSDLAGLEATQEARAEKLQKAIEYIEEAIKIYRDLGLQANIAMSLGTASICFRNFSQEEVNPEIRLNLIAEALGRIEEALDIFHNLGMVSYEMLSLNYAVMDYMAIAESQPVDLNRLEALCSRGLSLAREMGDQDMERLFEQVMQILNSDRKDDTD